MHVVFFLISCHQVGSFKISKITPSGLEVISMSDEGSRGFIPKMHLSDHFDNCKALLTSYQVGSIIEEAMYWSFSKHKLCPVSFTYERCIKQVNVGWYACMGYYFSICNTNTLFLWHSSVDRDKTKLISVNFDVAFVCFVQYCVSYCCKHHKTKSRDIIQSHTQLWQVRSKSKYSVKASFYGLLWVKKV